MRGEAGETEAKIPTQPDVAGQDQVVGEDVGQRFGMTP